MIFFSTLAKLYYASKKIFQGSILLLIFLKLKQIFEVFWLSVALAEDIFDSLDTFADYSLQHFWCHQQKYGIRNSLGYTLRLRSYKSPLWNVWHAFMLSIFTWLLSVIIVSNLWFLLCTFDFNETLWLKLQEKSFSRKAWSVF